MAQLLSCLKKNLADFGNLMVMTLLLVPGKIKTMVLLDRIYEEVHEKMREGQTGFRGGRSCADQIFLFGNII